MFKMKSSSFLKIYFSDYGLNVIYTLLKAYFKHLMKNSFFLSFTKKEAIQCFLIYMNFIASFAVSCCCFTGDMVAFPSFFCKP